MTEAVLANYAIILMATLTICLLAIDIYRFIKMPSEEKKVLAEEQLIKIKKWLLYEVTIAEQKYGGGAGKIKLSFVYDKFIERFPVAVGILTFDMFSDLVDEALKEMRKLLETNSSVKEIVENKGE